MIINQRQCFGAVSWVCDTFHCLEILSTYQLLYKKMKKKTWQGKIEYPLIILKLIYIPTHGRAKFGEFLYETTENNTRGASWVSIKTLPEEYLKQDHHFLIMLIIHAVLMYIYEFLNFKLLKFKCHQPSSIIHFNKFYRILH